MNKQKDFFSKQAVVSYSGGMDSTCLVLYLLAHGYSVNTYSFDYGQNHSVELQRAQENVRYMQGLGLPVSHQIINLRDAFSGDTSTLVQHTKAPEGDYRDETMKSTVVNNRNVIFSAVVFAKALSLAKRTLEGLKAIHGTDPQQAVTEEYLRKEATVRIALGVHAGDHCFTGNTNILTPEGFKTINDLKVGDDIYSFDPETFEVSLDKCIDIIPKGSNHEIYHINTTTGKIELTGEHEVYVCDFTDYNKSKGYIKNIVKKKVKDLSEGDYMVTSNKIPNIPGLDGHEDTINIMNVFQTIDHHNIFIEGDRFGFIRDNGGKTMTYPINMDIESFVKLMAWYITEGWTSTATNKNVSKYTSCFCQSPYKNLENCEEIHNILERLSIPLSVTESRQFEQGRPKEITYQFNSVISALMKTCGHRSDDKHIPAWLKQILIKSYNARLAFINTMCNGDGYFNEISGMWTYQSKSHKLIEDMCELIRLSGMYVKVGKQNRKSHTITISFGSTYRKQGLVRIGDAALTKILDINIICGDPQPVYDISVLKNHNFFAGEYGNLLISNSIYPDCTEASTSMARELYRISNWDSDMVEYSTPFVNNTKAEVLNAGVSSMKDLGLTDEEIQGVLGRTVSCYNATEDGRSCGKCGTCVERLEAFQANGMKDPAPYITE